MAKHSFTTALETFAPKYRSQLVALVLVSVTLVGCVGPITAPSPIAQKAAKPSFTPPPGKALVLIHRPRAQQGYPLYTGVWQGTNFITDLGNGHSTARVCEPGLQYFINRSVERVGVVESQLSADQTYDLWVNTAGAFIASFQLEPVKRGSRQWGKVPEWSSKNQWVERNSKAGAHESERISEIQLILNDFVNGPKQDRLRHLEAGDHR